jgi:hypothetical protein
VGGGSDSTQRSSSECVPVVDCLFRGTGTSIHDRFAGPGQKQLQVFGASDDKKMQIAWAAPSVKLVTMLERVQHLITPMVKYHFDDIVAGGRGYRGYRRIVANIAKAS